MTADNLLQPDYLNALTEESVKLTAATERIADALEKLLSMIESVQPSELAAKAKEHKTKRANLRKGGNKNGK